MQSIFAKAYQMSLGISPDKQKTGQKALEELYGAMEKGNVYAAKVLPYVAEIAKQMAQGGLAEARSSAYSERNRVMNTFSEGWKGFTDNGGSSGLSFFWKNVAMPFAEWWKDNAPQMGHYFELFVRGLNITRIALRDLINFGFDGESNDTVKLIESWGIDIKAIRTEVMNIFKSVGEAFNVGTEDSASFKERIRSFSNSLLEILRSIRTFIDSARVILSSHAEVTKDGVVAGTFKSFLPFTKESAAARRAVGAGFGMLGNLWNATGETNKAALGLAGYNLPDTDYSKNGAVGGQYPRLPTTPAHTLSPLGEERARVLENRVKIDLTVGGNPDLAGTFVTKDMEEFFKKEFSRQLGAANQYAPLR